jgi:formylglycine-generating enzyme required for sulfatase activity
VAGACSDFGADGDPPKEDGGAPPARDADPSSDGGGSDVDAGAPCARLHGAPAVRVGAFCIDATEATRGEYAEFLAEKGTQLTDQHPACLGGINATFQPTRGWPVVPGEERYPVQGVDWCDAWAFCKWAGKRLCGRIGGGPVGPADVTDPSKSEWYAACSAGGTRKYPYGNTYDPKACNGFDKHDAATRIDAVEDSPGCEGPPGVFDLSGNTYEWEDACDGPAGAASCFQRGGDYLEPGALLECKTAAAQVRGVGDRTGIRCCSD